MKGFWLKVSATCCCCLACLMLVVEIGTAYCDEIPVEPDPEIAQLLCSMPSPDVHLPCRKNASGNCVGLCQDNYPGDGIYCSCKKVAPGSPGDCFCKASS